MNIQEANPEDHLVLTDLMRKSKAIWGYSKEQLKLWEEELTISVQDILQNSFFKIKHQNQIVGFYSESIKYDNLKLDNLFIHPDFLSQGYGKLLLENFLKRSKSIQHKRVILEADPNAELFYLKHNFKTIALQKTSIANRYMPTMLYHNPQNKTINLFESDRLSVRHLKMSDIEAFYIMQSNPSVMKYIKPTMDYEESKSELKRFMDFYDNRNVMFRIWALIEKETNSFIGICGVYINKNNEMEIAYRLKEAYWGRGYGEESAKALIIFCFTTLEYEYLVACVREGNIGSKKILDKLMTYKESNNSEVLDHKYDIDITSFNASFRNDNSLKNEQS